MRRKELLLTFAASALTSCGMNPFGSGAQGGLDLYARAGQNMERPKSINDDKNGKDGSKTLVQEGVAATAALAKRGANPDPWIVQQGLSIDGDTVVYYEIVKEKPSEEDSGKLMTGRAEVRFGYGGPAPATLLDVDTTLITDFYSFAFLGRENKTWKTFQGDSQIDSLNIEVRFASTSIADIKPGHTRFWARNISAAVELGRGDTAKFTLDSLNDTQHIQFGSGVFLDANSGRASDEGPRSFAFDLQLIHKNSLGGNPYLRYQDNEGIVTFMLPWGAGHDSLHFMIHFFPAYDRTGEIRKNGPAGPVLAEFQFNEKSGRGTITYYNENGEIIGHEST